MPELIISIRVAIPFSSWGRVKMRAIVMKGPIVMKVTEEMVIQSHLLKRSQLNGNLIQGTVCICIKIDINDFF